MSSPKNNPPVIGVTPKARAFAYETKVRKPCISVDSRRTSSPVTRPDEIASGYVYLMNQTFVTGQTLFIDGGGLIA